MTAPTHVVGGIGLMAFFTLLVPTYRIDWLHILVGAVFSMLPDVDNPKAFIGRLLFPLSGPIDRRFGHRSITHSFFALILVTALSYLFLYLFSRSLLAYLPLAFTIFLAYFSHLFLDSMTKQGIQAYYPSRIWGVFPTRLSWRIRTGAKIEIIYFAIFVLCAIIFLPLGQTGLVHTFNRLFDHGGIETRLQEYEIKKKKVALGFTVSQIDSLLKVGAIDPKQAQELKAKLQEVEIQEQQFKGDQGLDE